MSYHCEDEEDAVKAILGKGDLGLPILFGGIEDEWRAPKMRAHEHDDIFFQNFNLTWPIYCR